MKAEIREFTGRNWEPIRRLRTVSIHLSLPRGVAEPENIANRPRPILGQLVQAILVVMEELPQPTAVCGAVEIEVSTVGSKGSQDIRSGGMGERQTCTLAEVNGGFAMVDWPRGDVEIAHDDDMAA